MSALPDIGSLPGGSRVLLLEGSHAHAECLHAQIRFLNALGVQVHLWLNRASPYRPPADEPVKALRLIDPEGLQGRILTAIELRKYLTQTGIGHLVINTAHGLLARDITLALRGHPVQVAGLCHHAEKLGSGITQNLISRRIKNYFVLHPYMQRWARPQEGVTISQFYNIFFVNPAKMGPAVLPAPGEEVRIVLPGALEPDRRDYGSLLALAGSGQWPAGVKVVLLGDASGTEYGRQLVRTIRAEGFGSYFELFESYISDTVFFEQMRRAAAVLTLLHPNVKQFEIFSRFSISGSYNLAFAFQKPILCVQDPFEGYEVFKDVGLFYQPDQLGELLSHIAADPVGALTPRLEGYARLPELGFDYQARQYGQALFGAAV